MEVPALVFVLVMKRIGGGDIPAVVAAIPVLDLGVVVETTILGTLSQIV